VFERNVRGTTMETDQGQLKIQRKKREQGPKKHICLWKIICWQNEATTYKLFTLWHFNEIILKTFIWDQEPFPIKRQHSSALNVETKAARSATSLNKLYICVTSTNSSCIQI